MKNAGSLDLIVTIMVGLLLHIPVYVKYRHNQRDGHPPKVWLAFLLCFVASPTCGLLYVDGVIPALMMLGGLIATMSLWLISDNLKSFVPLLLVILTFVPPMRAKQVKDAMTHGSLS
jgi:hypothetical protein